MESVVEVSEVASRRRRYWTTEEKRRMVEETLSSTSSVASLARQHGVNANQLFYWRKQYQAGQLRSARRSEMSPGVRLLPVSVEGDEPSEAEPVKSERSASGVTMNIEIPGRALVSLEGAVDAEIVRTVIESLRG